MKKKQLKINNRIIPGKEYTGITLADEKIVKTYIDKMMIKLCKLKNVEYFEPYPEENEPASAGEFNSDTAFREVFYDIIEEETRKGLYKYG